MTLSAAEELSHATARIQCTLSDGRISTGTGFFYDLTTDGASAIPLLVTNKHVIEDADTGRLLFTQCDEHAGPDLNNHCLLEVTDFEKCWIPHPDPKVDLCVFPIAPLLQFAKDQGAKVFSKSVNRTFIPSEAEIDDMIGLEEVTMVGYPNGLWDETHNLPIFRRGVLASHYKHDWNGRKEFLIDAACFPGSSGSPVLLFDIGSYKSKKGNFIGDSRIKLLGVLYAGPYYTIEGESRVVPVPTTQKEVYEVNIPNNLGIIIKSIELIAFDPIMRRYMQSGTIPHSYDIKIALVSPNRTTPKM